MRNHAADQNQVLLPERLDEVADEARAESRFDERQLEFGVDVIDAVEDRPGLYLDAERLPGSVQNGLIMVLHMKIVS